MAALAVLFAVSIWFGMGDPQSIDGSEIKAAQRDAVVTVRGMTQTGAVDVADPAAALKLGLWPGLPSPPGDAEAGPDSEDPVRYNELEIEDAEEMASSIIDGSYAEMVATVDDLSGAVEAVVAVEIGDRLSECWDYSEQSLNELEEAGAKAFENKLRFGEAIAAQMAPGVAEKAVREMALLDRDGWIADWIAEQVIEQETRHPHCAGVEAIPRNERAGVAFQWWTRAADLGNLKAKAQWVGMALYNTEMYPGNAVGIAELKPRMIDAIHELLRERYAPILLQLVMFDRQGIFAPPDPQQAWIYGEALRRIVQKGSVGHWQIPDEMIHEDFTGVREAIQRFETELTPAQLREARAWVRAIVELPSR